jgi:hypothetical protein
VPNRILREGILTSPRMAKLGWAEEVFYRRLMSVVDDYGRYYADAGLLRAGCYPRQLNKVSDSDVGKWLRACADAALVRVYPAKDGESYLELLDFRQQVRAKDSKFPGPAPVCDAPAVRRDADAITGDAVAGTGEADASACVADATQAPSKGEASAPVFVFGDGDGDGDGDGGDPQARKRAAPTQTPERPEGVGERVWADWLTLRKAKKAPVTETVLEGAMDQASLAGMTLEAFLKEWCERGSQGLKAEWLQQSKPASNAPQMRSKPTSGAEQMAASLAKADRIRQAREAGRGMVQTASELIHG